MRLRGVVVVAALVAAVPALAQVKQRDHRKKKGDDGQNVPANPAPPPKGSISVSGFTPTKGRVGTRVTITGSGFVGQDKVLVGGRPVKVDSITDTQIVFTFPDKYYDGVITIRHPGAANDVTVGTFIVEADPAIATFAPTQGPAGTRVEIRGSGFMNGDQVLFSGKVLPAAEMSADRIVVVIPDGAATDAFTIARPSTGFKAVSRGRFTVILPAPTIASIAPTAGPPGTQVRITGANFAADDRVFYGRTELVPTARTATTIDVVIPANAARSESLLVKGPRGQATSGVFTLVLPPEIATFDPAFGPAGTRVTIFGAHFMAGDTVFLSGTQLKMTSLEDSRIVVEIPPGAKSGAFEVRRGGQVMSTSKKAFDVVAPPVISGFAPAGGPIGTKVTITGQHFSPDARVLYGAQTLRIAGRQGDTAIEVLIPPNATNQKFVVETRGGAAESAAIFQVHTYTVVTSVSPASGPVGTRVWIRGRNFNSTSLFYLNNVSLPIVEQHAEGYVVSIPAGASSGVIEVESYGRREATRFRFDVLLPPALSSFAPNMGPPGTQVTITGANFTDRTAAFFGNLPCRVISRTPPSIVVVEIPAGAQGTDYLWVEDAGTRIKSTQTFQVIAPPVLTSFAPISGPVGTQVTLTGSNFTATTTVAFGNVPAAIVRLQAPTQLVVTVPAGVVGAQFIWVEDHGQKVRSAQTFHIVPTPVVTSLAPLSGPAGTQVTLTGDNFSPRAQVWFGSLACPIVRRVGSTQLVVQIPAGAKGKAALTVEDHGQRVDTAQAFEVVEPPAPPPEPANHHEHAHDHPHAADDHHHHPHAHPHRSGANHHHPY